MRVILIEVVRRALTTLFRLPDSALELLDEACTQTALGVNPTWEALGSLKRRQVILEMEIQSLDVSLVCLHVGDHIPNPGQRDYDDTSMAEAARLREELNSIDAQVHAYVSVHLYVLAVDFLRYLTCL